MGNYHCQQPIKTGQIVSFPKLKANCSEVRFTKSPKTLAPIKKKKKKKKRQKKKIFFFDSRFKRQLQHRRTKGHSQGHQSQQQMIEQPR